MNRITSISAIISLLAIVDIFAADRTPKLSNDTVVMLATLSTLTARELPPKAPKPGDHILNPSNRKELLSSIARLETENQKLTGHKRPSWADWAKIPADLNNVAVIKAVDNRPYA